jgi:hypothetical protein
LIIFDTNIYTNRNTRSESIIHFIFLLYNPGVYTWGYLLGQYICNQQQWKDHRNLHNNCNISSLRSYWFPLNQFERNQKTN